MKFFVALPTDHVDPPGEFVGAGTVATMAAALEAAGVDGCFVTDHPAPDDRWLAGGGHHALEPTVALSFAAAATERLALLTNIYVVAYRSPLLAAKTLATLDVLSGGRLVVGVAAGYLRSEFLALGADFEHRNEVLDESLATMRAARTGDSVVGTGSGWSARGNTILPVARDGAGPPLWCGGNSRRAIERAVRFGAGWLPFPTSGGLSTTARTAAIESLADLSARIDLMGRLCDEAGREDRPEVCFSPFARDGEQFLDELGRLAAMGVTSCMITLPGRSMGEWTDAVDAFGASISGSTN